METATGNKSTEVKDTKEVKAIKPPKEEKVKKERKPRKERQPRSSSNENQNQLEQLLAVDISQPENLIKAGFSIGKLNLLYIKAAIDYLKEVK